MRLAAGESNILQSCSDENIVLTKQSNVVKFIAADRLRRIEQPTPRGARPNRVRILWRIAISLHHTRWRGKKSLAGIPVPDHSVLSPYAQPTTADLPRFPCVVVLPISPPADRSPKKQVLYGDPDGSAWAVGQERACKPRIADSCPLPPPASFGEARVEARSILSHRSRLVVKHFV